MATVQEVDGQTILKRKPRSPGKPLSTNPRKAAASIPKEGVIYLLPEDGALRRDRRLPSASRAHIRDIMNLQMASETPFTVDEVYTDSIVTGEDDATREIMVSQALAPRPAIDAILQRMRDAHGIELTGVDVMQGETRAGFNLLPADSATARRGSLLSPLRILALLFVFAAIFAAVSWRDLQERRIAASDKMIAAAEGNAGEALKVNKQLTDGIEGIEKLGIERRNPLSFLRVYNVIAGLLPDSAWLEDFSYEQPVASITGLAANSGPLIEAIESSPLVEKARFASPIVTDPRTGGERFRLEVTFKTQPAAPAGAAPAGEEPQQ